MKGRHYMEKGFKSGEAQALRIAKEVAEEELKKSVQIIEKPDISQCWAILSKNLHAGR